MKGAGIQEVGQEMAILWPKLVGGTRDPLVSRLQLSSSQMVVMATLHDLGQCKVGILARAKGVSLPTMTGLIDRLIIAGFLRRRRDKHDRRAVLVSLTPKGETTILQILDMVKRRWMAIAAHLTASEREAYIKILRKIIEVVSEENKL